MPSPPRRIAILTQYFAPEMGAPQSRLYETALGLKRLGWQVLIITAMPNYPSGKIFPAYSGIVFQMEKMDGLQLWRAWLYASNSRRALPRILSMLSFSGMSLLSLKQLLRFRPDYIITESPPLALGITGLILARLTGARHILNVSDIWPLSAHELGALHKDSRLYRWLESLERYLYRKSFACLGQSRQIVNHLNTHGAKKSWLFRNGVDISRFEALPRNLSQRPLKIVYAGLLGVAQGIFNLCRQLRLEAEKVEFHIYGDGPERKAIERFLSDKQAPGIVLHQAVPREAIPKTLAQFDLTLIPLAKPIYGAVPSKIYEAMAAGLPIIFAGGGEGAEIVSQYGLGWVCEPSDFEAIQSVIERISMDGLESIAQKSRNCLQSAREVFSREMQIAGLNDFLTDEHKSP